jgi:hypothetical protein
MTTDDKVMRSFDTGATRDTADGKLDMEGFTHPMVEKQFAKYMNMNRLQSDGQLRDSDNWQKGIPQDAYIKSLKRHYDEVWANHRGFHEDGEAGIIAALCGIIFNAKGYLLEHLKYHDFVLQDFDGDDPTPEMADRQDALCDTKDEALPEDKTRIEEIIGPAEDENTFCGNDRVGDNCETCTVGTNECKFSGLMCPPVFPKEIEFLDTDVPEGIELLQDAQRDMEKMFTMRDWDIVQPWVEMMQDWNEELEEVPELPVCFGVCGDECESCLECKDKNECTLEDDCWDCEFSEECAGDFERREMSPFCPAEEPKKPDYGTHNCLTCMSVDKPWKSWPCSECLNNHITHDTEKTHDFYSPQGNGLV